MKLVQSILFIFLMWLGASAMADATLGQPVGKVIFATGNAALQPESGVRVAGETGTPVYVGQTLSTGSGGNLHVQMMDGGLLMLRPDSSIRIAYYTVDLVHPANTKILLDMKKGVVRSVTGKGGQTNKQGFRMNTPTAAIGIKGTDFTVLATAQLSSVTLREGGVAVSPFSPLCQRYAVGACSSSQTVMLTAVDQQMLAEVRAAKAVRIPKINAEVIPDNVAPAHPAEEKSVQDAKGTQATLGSTTNTTTTTATPAATTASGATQTQAATGAQQGGAAGSSKATTSGSTLATTAGATSNANAESTTPGLTNANGTAVEKVKASDDTKFTPIAASETRSSSSAGATAVKETALSGSTAEVASLSPVTAEVGPKDSVTSELASRIVAEKTLGSTVNNVLIPVAPTPATPEPAKPQPFYWGRWASYAENPEQVIVRDPVKNKQIFAANQVYLVADSEAGAPQLPTSGKATFNLDKGEAGILRDGALVKASISDASLEANFDNNRFKTGLTVNSDSLRGGAVALTAEGSLSQSAGTFRNDAALSTMNVSGAFSEGAQHAGYEFNDPDNNIVGATSWQR